MKREIYTVVLNRPEGVSVEAMKAYITRAIQGWPLFPVAFTSHFTKRGNKPFVQRRRLDHD